MNSNHQISFHESTITKFLQLDRRIIIELEEVTTNGSKCDFRITCLEVQEIKTDEDIIHEVSMNLPDGEILTLEIEKTELFMIVEWNDFENKIYFTKSHQIKCKEIQTEELSRPETLENETPINE